MKSKIVVSLLSTMGILALGREAYAELSVHSYVATGIDINLLQPAGSERVGRDQIYWIGGQKPSPYFFQRGVSEFIGKTPIAKIQVPKTWKILNRNSISAIKKEDATYYSPVIDRIGPFVEFHLEDRDREAIAKLVPSSGYGRYVIISNDMVLGEVTLPAGGPVEQLSLKIDGASQRWISNLDELIDLLVKLGGKPEPGHEKELKDQFKVTEFKTIEMAFSVKSLDSPLKVTVSANSPEIFVREPLVWDLKIENRGIPSVGFYYSCQVVEVPENFPRQFAITGPNPTAWGQLDERMKGAVSVKYLESKTLSFNSVRDFSMDYTAPGPIEIPLRGQFFQYLDGKGITETTKFTVKVLPLPEEHLRKLEEWKSRVDPEQVVSVEQMTANGKELSLLILRRAGKVARVLRFGELPVSGKWSLAQDTASGQMHILFSQATGGQTYWQTEPLLTGLLAPEVFKEGKRRTLQISADGKVLLAVEP